MSSASTPAPSGTPLELQNYVQTPRPFKNPSYNKNANRRTRTLKQILTAERDALNGLDPSSSSKKAGGSNKSKRLVGAAAAAVRRREAANESGTATPAEGEAGDTTMMTEPDGDTTMASMTTFGSISKKLILNPEEEAEAESLLKRKRALPSYTSVEAPPSLRPRKKFCDVTGLVAPYTDPRTNLRYHNVEIYEIIKTFGPGVDQDYLSLRGEASQIK